MLRLLAVFCALVCLQEEAAAALSRQEPVNRPTERRDTVLAAGRDAAPAQGAFSISENTEILLDGNPCKFAEIPAKATIIQMDLTPDKKTIHRIHFRSGK